jgi:tetratricopeptide (TPR) repeat protein
MRVLSLALALTVQIPTPDLAQIQQWFEAGQDEQVVQAAEGRAEPEVLYLAGLSHQKLERANEARQIFEQLAGRPASDPWSHIGTAAALLVESTPAAEVLVRARQSAGEAVALEPTLTEAHYQLGRVYALQRQYEQAAEAFDAAIEADRYFAYAHYFAGMSYRQIRRIDQMAIRFESFMKLAPDAPERLRVEAMMRTVRGR